MSTYSYRHSSNADITDVVCALVVIFVVIFIAHGCSKISDAVKYGDYVETVGVITEVDAVVIRTSTGKAIISSDKFSLTYTYEVNGNTYTGAMVNDVSVSAGTEIKVLYDPVEPEKSKGELFSN